jgi:hypothetical protein
MINVRAGRQDCRDGRTDGVNVVGGEILVQFVVYDKTERYEVEGFNNESRKLHLHAGFIVGEGL